MNESKCQVLELTDSHIASISALVHKTSGLDIEFSQKEAVRSRLARRLSELNIDDFNGYLRYVKSDRSGKEMNLMAEMLTTNYTFFFREMKHFEFIKDVIIAGIKERGGRFSIWCAGCSTGEEPYSIAMLLRENLDPALMSNVRIRATDISERVLAAAARGIYAGPSIKSVPEKFLAKYFTQVSSGPVGAFRISDEIRKSVSFERLNLVEDWPLQTHFDLIFCRNVMIYFDKPTKENLIKRFFDTLSVNGHFFIGHSESLISLANNFKYLKPAVYKKLF